MVCSYGKSNTRMKRLFLFIFILLYSYAVLRYHFGKNVPWSEWYYILNKAFAWTGFTLICLSVLQQKWLDNLKTTRRELGVLGFCFVIIHAVSVLFLFNPEHYPKFYSGQEINSLGWIIISIGLLSMLSFSLPFIAAMKSTPATSRVFKLGKIGVLISVFHPLLIGYSGWFSPGSWPYFMPPITLLAVLFCLLVFMIRLLTNNK